jgi:4-amino-4-deoxy-L-arabinose transferase-like glycosyltransferase
MQPCSNRRFLALYAGLFVFLALWLGNRGLNDPDEGRYVNIAQHFLEPGADPWEPVLSGFSHYDKPPLVYWCTAVCLKIFGATEWAARLTPLFGAYLTLIGLGWAAWRWHGRETAFWAVLVCGTFGQFWLLARFLTPDMFMTGWCALAVGAWAECRHRGGHWGFWLLSLLFWSLAWWAKATPCLVPLAGLALGLKMTGDRAGWQALRPGLLFPGILILGCGWYVVMMVRHPELVRFFFGRELMGRVTGHVQGRKGPIYYYLGVGLLGWLPWWPLAARAAWKIARPRIDGWRDFSVRLGLEGWMALTGFVIFSLISSKLPTYTLCLAPWVALLAARLLLLWRREAGEKVFKFWTVFLPLSAGVVYLGLVLIAPRFESRFALNSSIRPVAKVLNERGVTDVYFDHYWPSAEFYLGPKVHFVLPDTLQQRADDPGLPTPVGRSRFYRPETWREALERSPKKPVWLVRYEKPAHSPFDPVISGAKAPDRIKIGDFLLVRLR